MRPRELRKRLGVYLRVSSISGFGGMETSSLEFQKTICVIVSIHSVVRNVMSIPRQRLMQTANKEKEKKSFSFGLVTKGIEIHS